MANKLSFKYGTEHERGRLYYVQGSSTKTPLIAGQVLFAYKQFDTNKHYPYKAFIDDTVAPQGDIRIYMDVDANARVPISTYFSDYSSQLWDLTNAKAVMEGDTDEPVYFNNGVPVQCSGVVVTSEAQTFNGNKTFTGTISTPKIEMPSTGGSGKISIYFVNSANTRTLYIRDYNTSTAYIATTSGTSSVGSGTNPVYVNGSGVIKASSSTKGSTSLPMYLSSGIFSTCVPQDMFSAMSWTNGTDNGPTLSLTMFGYTRSDIIPSATNSISGVVTTGTQTFAGDKTFTGAININTESASSTNNGIEYYLSIGDKNDLHMIIDADDIQAMDGDSSSSLYLNFEGGDVCFGPANDDLEQTTIKEDGSAYFVNKVQIADITASTSSTSGALIVNGGIGVAKTSYMSSIFPKVTGDCLLGGENNIWADVYSGRYHLTDSANKYAGGMIYCTSSTSTSSQPTCVTLGNTTATGTAGSRYGELRLYSQGTKYSRIITEDNSSSNRTVTIPALDGNMTLSETTATNDGVAQRIAFYTTNYKRLGSTSGFTVIAQNGDNADNGRVKLYLGNSTPSGTLGNQFGELTLYGTTDKAIAIAAEPGLSDDQRIYLRKYYTSSNTDAYLVATLGTTAVGDSDEPVYISSNGVATKCSGVVVTTGTQTFTGNKTFASIYFSNNSYSHGSIVTSSSTSTTSQATTFTIGNTTATGTAGSRYGIVKIYGTKSYAGSLSYSTSATGNTNHYLPPSGGTLMNGNYMVGVSGTTYGTVTQMNALSSPNTGQMFFVLV